MKKVIVNSFQRSGTHFLINNLSTNFEGIGHGWVDIVRGRDNKWVRDVMPRNLKEKIYEQTVDVYYVDSSTKCLKSHYQAYFFERYLEKILEKYDVFYMIRDPRDVMVACYNYYNNTNFERFIKESNFSKFLRAKLWEVQTETQPFSYSYVKPRDIVDKWFKHVISWLPYKDKGVNFITFYDLKTNLGQTLKRIADCSQQRLRHEMRPVSVDDTRYRPDFRLAQVERGSIGIWKKYFSESDLEYLYSVIPRELLQVAGALIDNQ